MTDVTLTASSRDAVLLLQRTADLHGQTTRRLSTGLRVARASDDVPAFFQAKALNSRVSGLLQAKDNVGQGGLAVEAALVGLDAIEDLTNQLKSLALSVRGASAEGRLAAAEQFDVLREQITSLANDAGLNGGSLIGANPSDLNVAVNEVGATVTIAGAASDAAGLGISTAAGSFNNFATDANIDAAIEQLNSAIVSIRSRAQGFGSSVASLQIRSNFIDDLTQTLDAGAAKLVNADLNEEAARLLSTQLRQHLGVDQLRVAGQSASLIAELL
jgi:flagellin